MQSAIDAAYLGLSQQLGIGVVPVGEAWTTRRRAATGRTSRRG